MDDQAPLAQPDWVKKEGERIRQAVQAADRERQDRSQPPRVTFVPASGLLTEREKMESALRDAKPNALKDGLGLRGHNRDQVRRFTDFGDGSIERSTRTETAIEDEQAATTQQVGFSPNISFLLKDATTTTGGVVSNKVKVYDGKINGEFPTGMGTGDYVIDLADPDDSVIYAGVTFNPTTLDITSRFVGVSTQAGFPESRVESETEGFLYWQIGYTYFDDDGVFTIWNTKLGNIDFAITYGANGSPARPHMLPVDSQPGWIDLDAIFPP